MPAASAGFAAPAGQHRSADVCAYAPVDSSNVSATPANKSFVLIGDLLCSIAFTCPEQHVPADANHRCDERQGKPIGRWYRRHFGISRRDEHLMMQSSRYVPRDLGIAEAIVPTSTPRHTAASWTAAYSFYTALNVQDCHRSRVLFLYCAIGSFQISQQIRYVKRQCTRPSTICAEPGPPRVLA